MNRAKHRPVLHRLTLGISVVFFTEMLSNVDGAECIIELKRELPGPAILYPNTGA